MTPQELKSSILQLAVQGKLVEQRPEEGTGEELYQQIQAEKQKLIKEGKIKKEKPLPEILEDEIPFEIPDSWIWVRLGACSSYSQRKEKVSADAITPDMWSLDLEDIEKGTGKIIRRCTISERTIAGDKVCFHKGQVLYSKLRPYLKKVLVAPDDGICSSEMVPFTPYGNINPQYLVYVLTCPHIDYVINSVTYGVKMPRVGTETMSNLLIPLPPLAEQKRIVTKIEELLPYIARYEKAWSRLEDFNKRFPVDMQKSILQMAIQGKLVEQCPEEGTGEELYQQIQAEKQKLIKAGTIKKEKPLPEISEDEIPFDIPENWRWVRLGKIVRKLTDGSHNPPPNTGSGYPVISAKNVKNGLITFENVDRYTDEIGFTKENPRTDITKGDIILGIIGGSIGNIAVYTHDEKVIAQRSIAIMTTMIDTDYFVQLLKSPLIQNSMQASAAGSAQGGVYLGTLSNFLIPLPPLSEQKRIVAKLEEILPLCERLK